MTRLALPIASDVVVDALKRDARDDEEGEPSAMASQEEAAHVDAPWRVVGIGRECRTCDSREEVGVYAAMR
jgi:hypothetical protein